MTYILKFLWRFSQCWFLPMLYIAILTLTQHRNCICFHRHPFRNWIKKKKKKVVFRYYWKIFTVTQKLSLWSVHIQSCCWPNEIMKDIFIQQQETWMYPLTITSKTEYSSSDLGKRIWADNSAAEDLSEAFLMLPLWTLTFFHARNVSKFPF